MWEAEAGVPKLPGIHSPLENCTEETGMKGWGPHGPAPRLGTGAPKLLGIQALLGLRELGMELGAHWLRMMTGAWKVGNSSLVHV